MPAGTREEWVTVDGLRVRLLVAGEGDPVLLLHGLGLWAEVWEAALNGMAGSFTLMAPDLPGCGLSERPSRVALARAFAPESPFLAQHIGRLLDALGIRRAHLVGSSLGGAIALMVAATVPDRVRSLVLACPGGLGREVSVWLRALSLPGVGIYVWNPGVWRVRKSLRLLFHDRRRITDRLVRLAWERWRRPGARAVFLALVRAGVDIGGQRRALLNRWHPHFRALRLPILVVWGERDRVIPIAHAGTALSVLSGARVLALPDCGHLPQVEQADRFLEALGLFLSGRM